nr:DUF2000 family protein [Vibrio sinaloensis]
MSVSLANQLSDIDAVYTDSHDLDSEPPNTPEAELEYLGICLFSEAETLRELTMKFSLYR